MTLQELSQYYKLRERLNRDEEILESLRAAACPGGSQISLMAVFSGWSWRFSCS